MLKTVMALGGEWIGRRGLVLTFDVPDEKFDLIGAVKAAALEFCRTKDGEVTLDYSFGSFNLVDFAVYVPNEICAKHGFAFAASPVADFVVDWGEQLVNKDDLFQDKGYRIKGKGDVSPEATDLDGAKAQGGWFHIDGLPMGIVDATYVSVWDGGFKVETSCKVNRETGEVFHIEASDVDADGLDVLEAEYVRFSNGMEVAVADGFLVETDTLLDIEAIRDYMDTVQLDDYDLGGCEITEDDLHTIRERVNDSGSKLEDVVHGYLLEIREVLDAGLDDGVIEADDGFPLRNYDDAVNLLYSVLNKEGRDSSRDGNELLKIAEFVPIFKSENYFGIYVWNNDENAYYLVDRNTGKHEMVLGDSFEFVGQNTLDCMKDEKILHVHNKEFMRYLIDFSLDNVKSVVPEAELRGIAVLEAALREAVKREGKFMMGQSLLERIEAAERSSASEGFRKRKEELGKKDCMDK